MNYPVADHRGLRKLPEGGGFVRTTLGHAYAWGARGASVLWDVGIRRPGRTRWPVISVGALTAGGAGKTPITRWLARELLARGLAPGILTRGYASEGGTDARVVDPRAPDVARDGDEPALLARSLPDVAVVVCADRLRGAEVAGDHGADILLLDDGFQHRRLARDYDLVLWDRRSERAQGALLPAGALREPLSALRRASGVLLVDRGDGLPGRPAGARVVGAVRLITGAWRDVEAGTPVHVISGIADPASFERSLVRWGLPVTGATRHADHHPFTPVEIGRAAERAGREGAALLATTAKDWMRWPREAPHVPVPAVFDLDVEGDARELVDGMLAAVREELMTNRLECVTLVLGSGIAGLTFALKAARWGDVIILTKKNRADSSTNWAQGGVASVMDDDDNYDLHVRDTLAAGAGLCRPDAVRTMVEEGPRLIRELIDFGARFTWGEAGQLDLGREGGHSRRRIVHANDLTGREIERTLLSAVESNPRIRLLENHFTLDLWVGPASGDHARRCYGATWFTPSDGQFGVVRAQHTLLATGGCGKVYLYTTNPDIATADGVAMGARAGCSIVNLEFVQFHPTCLYHPDAKSFLISEAVRGEGAVLRNLAGEPFLRHAQGSLATRDIVAREIDREMKSRGDKHVQLDVSPIGEERFRARFPAISERLIEFGFRPGVDPIPVVPAAHYMCGGVAVDMDGRTEIEGLSAAGEVSYTGVHGANRLASNSLLEALVVADRAARRPPPPPRTDEPPLPQQPGKGSPPSDVAVILDHEWDGVRRLLWDYVGLVRTRDRLDRAIERLTEVLASVEDLYDRTRLSTDLAELRNIALVGLLLARAARHRSESRGLHFLVENPESDPVPRETWILPDANGFRLQSRDLGGSA